MVHDLRLDLYALFTVVGFGIGFLFWTLYHLIREAHPHEGGQAQPVEHLRLRR